MCWVSLLKVTCVQASKVDLFMGAKQGSLTQWQMVLVACFTPDRVNDTEGYVSTAPCSVALFWSSAQLMVCYVCCMVLFLCVVGASVTKDIEKRSAEIRCACSAELCGVDWCSTRKIRYTRLHGRETVSQCSYYSLRRAMLMLRRTL